MKVIVFNSMFILMLVVYMMSFYLVFGFDEWFFVWLGLELNMISFLMLGFKSEDLLIAEAMGKYFFVQSLGSGMLLGMMYIGWSDVVWCLLLSLKMGVGPFYFWYIKVLMSFNWELNFILMVFQKVILLLLMSELLTVLVIMVGGVSMLVGMMGVFNQVNVKAILGFSSVFHSGWMMCLLMDSTSMWWVYLFIYSLMMWGVVDLLSNMNVVGLNSIFSGFIKKSLMMMVLNLGGVPPMIGFILSWLTFYVLWEFDCGMLILMLIMSVGMLYVYMRIVYDVTLGGLSILGWGVGMGSYSWGEIFSFLGLFLLIFIV